MRSSDLFELNQRLNWVKKISMFHGSIGFYIIMCIMAYSVTLYVIAMLLFAISGISLGELHRLGSIYSSEFILALGFIYMLPGVVEQFIQCVCFCSALLHSFSNSLSLIAKIRPANDRQHRSSFHSFFALLRFPSADKGAQLCDESLYWSCNLPRHWTQTRHRAQLAEGTLHLVPRFSLSRRLPSSVPHQCVLFPASLFLCFLHSFL